MDSASKSRSLPRHIEIKDQVAYSSADEDYTRRGGGSKVGSRAARLRSRDEKKPHSGNRRAMEYPLNSSSGGSGAKSRPSRLVLQHNVNDPALSRSHDSLVGVTPTGGSSKRDKKQQFLPDVVKSSGKNQNTHTRLLLYCYLCMSEQPSVLLTFFDKKASTKKRIGRRIPV